MSQHTPDNEHPFLDENPDIKDEERLPVHPALKVHRYRTIKKNSNLGWWSAVVLVEDHDKKQVCFYRWRKRKGQWKRDKKLPFHSHQEWNAIKGTVESFFEDIK